MNAERLGFLVAYFHRSSQWNRITHPNNSYKHFAHTLLHTDTKSHYSKHIKSEGHYGKLSEVIWDHNLSGPFEYNGPSSELLIGDCYDQRIKGMLE